MLELFIYYRIAPTHAEQAARVVRAWQSALRARHPGLQARLLKRWALQQDTEGAPAPETWMETYAASAPTQDGRDLVAELQDELGRGPRELMAGDGRIERHLEIFLPCAS